MRFQHSIPIGAALPERMNWARDWGRTDSQQRLPIFHDRGMARSCYAAMVRRSFCSREVTKVFEIARSDRTGSSTYQV